MPNTVQVLGGKSMSSLSAHPVFDVLIKESLYTASLTFRSKGVFPYPPGTVVCCFQATNTPFVAEEMTYDSQGVSEVRCISVWELLKRRNGTFSYKHAFPIAYKPLTSFEYDLELINKDPNRWFVFWLRAAVVDGYRDYQVSYDPSKSIYDDVYDAAVYNQLYLTSYITETSGNSNNVDVTLVVESLNRNNSIFDLGPLDSVTTRVTRRLPLAPTHWRIGMTKDYGGGQMASRGRIRTWYENRAYMQNTTDWKGPYRYETAISGDEKRNWGEITEEIKCEPLKSVSVDIDVVQVGTFQSLTIGRIVSGTTMGVMFTGYVIERTVSGGDLTTYSVKVQPDRFYENGREVTDNWI